MPRKVPARKARTEEIALLRVMEEAGPIAVATGPIGRILKKNWCRLVLQQGRLEPVYEITSEGRDVISRSR